MPKSGKRGAKWPRTELPPLAPGEERLARQAMGGRLTGALLGEYLAFAARRRAEVDAAVGRAVPGWPEAAGRAGAREH